MKVKNLVLFGFVLSALNYLSSQARKEEELGISKSELDELKDIDLEQIRHEIGDKLEKMVGELGAAVSSIVNIGSEAFDRYVNEAKEEELAEDANDMQHLLARVQEAMSSFPNTEKEVLEDENDEKEEVEEVHKESSEECQCSCEKTCECQKESSEECSCEEACDGECQEEKSECNCHCEEEVKHEEACSCGQEEDVCEEECSPKEESSEEIEEISLSSEEEEELIRSLENILGIEEMGETEKTSEEKEEDYVKEIQESLENSFREEANEEVVEKECACHEEDEHHECVEEEKEEFDSSKFISEIDQIFSGIFPTEEKEEAVEEKEAVEEIAIEEETTGSASEEETVEEDEISAYVRHLVEELEREEKASDMNETAEEATEEAEEITTEVEEEKVEEAEEETTSEEDEIYQQINEMYPYLSKEFIVNVYNLKEVIAQNYPLNELVLVLHRVHFDRLDDLQQFVEIVSNHGYNVNVDENKMIVDLFRRYQNTDGKILSNIFEIANQAGLLHGVYEGYWINTEKEDSF